MDCKHLLPVDLCTGNICTARGNRSGAMVMVEIIAGAIGRRRRCLVMIDQCIQKRNATMRSMMIGWFRVSQRGRVNRSRKKREN